MKISITLNEIQIQPCSKKHFVTIRSGYLWIDYVRIKLNVIKRFGFFRRGK